MNDGSPAIVVLLDSARSAEPPHSSGMPSARAPSTLPEAARVAMPLASAGKTGRAFSKPSGSAPATRRSSSAARSALALRHAAYRLSHAWWAALPRALTLRAWASTPRSTSKALAGRSRAAPWWRRPRRRRAPSRATCRCRCLVGAGQAMMVCRRDEGGLGARAAGSSRAPRAGRRRPRRSRRCPPGRRAAPVDVDDVPAVGLVALGDVLAERDVGVVLDGDLVRVVDRR